MKQTENYEQLLERFSKRTAQLSKRADELYGAYTSLLYTSPSPRDRG